MATPSRYGPLSDVGALRARVGWSSQQKSYSGGVHWGITPGMSSIDWQEQSSCRDSVKLLFAPSNQCWIMWL